MKSARGGAGTGRRDAPSPAPLRSGELRQTLLLPLVFERVDEDQPLTVLDVGSGVAETVRFFSEYRCRVHFADLFDEPALRLAPQEDPEEFFDAVFTDLLSFDPDTRFDICLLWDFLNYLSVPALRAFSRALQPYLHRGTVGHGFGAFKATAPAAAWATPSFGVSYGVHDRERLVVRPRRDRSAATVHPHSRTVLADAFGCFEIVRGTLLKEGAMELLLQAR